MTYLFPSEYSKILSTEKNWIFFQTTFDPNKIRKKILAGLNNGHIYWSVMDIYSLFDGPIPKDTITLHIYQAKYKTPKIEPCLFMDTKVFLNWFLDTYQKNGSFFSPRACYTSTLCSFFETFIHKLFQIQLEMNTGIENFAKDAKMFFDFERLTRKGWSNAPWDDPDAGKPLTTKQIHDFKTEILGIGVD